MLCGAAVYPVATGGVAMWGESASVGDCVFVVWAIVGSILVWTATSHETLGSAIE